MSTLDPSIFRPAPPVAARPCLLVARAPIQTTLSMMSWHGSPARRGRWTAAAVAAAAAVAVTVAWARPSVRPASSPAASAARPVPPGARPIPTGPGDCSLDGRICVHSVAPAVSTAALARTLREALRIEQAYRALDLPAPLPDDFLGGSSAYDLYLDPRAPGIHTEGDPPALLARFDRSSAFTVVSPPGAAEGCSFGLELARALAEASLLGLDAALGPGVMAMQASYLATLVAPCPTAEIAAIDTLQRSPERPLTAAPADALAGSLLFPWYLDAAYGTGRPAGVMTGLIAISLQHAPPGGSELVDEPDVFDALRRATRDRGSSLDALLLDFAVARAFLGDRSDGGHLPSTERFGAMGRPRFEWSVPFASLPRRLGPLHPIHPTGATFLWLDLEDAPAGAQLRFVAEWDPGQMFRWALVKVDGQGREQGRIVAPGKFGDHRVVLTVADLAALAGIIVVGTHLGGDDRSQPFDPDAPLARPALYSVTLYAASP